jgi:hypothetical protein
VRTRVKDNYERGIARRAGAFDLTVFDGRLRATLVGTNGSTSNYVYVNGSTEIDDGQWHHVALTYNGAVAQLYLDGSKDGPPTSYAGRVSPAVGAPLEIGRASAGFIGDLDEVALYGTSLDEVDLQRRFSHRWTPPQRCDGTSPYSSLLCAAQPTGYWRLGESFGYVVQDEVALSDGAAGGDVTLRRQGAIDGPDRAAYFSGSSSSVITVPYEPYGSYAGMKKLTAEAWVRTSTKDNYERGILSRQESFDLSIVNGKLKATLLVFNGTNNYRFYVNGVTELHDGQWHHVAVTYDGSTAQLYLDGEKDGPATTYAGRLLPAIGAPVRIGAGSSGFIGEIDEAALYDRPLMSLDIQKRAPYRWTPTRECERTTSYPSAVCDSNPTGYWRLGDHAGTPAVDHVGLSDGSVAAGVTLPQSGATSDGDSAAYFSGSSSSVITVPYEPYGSYAAMKKLTAEAWVRTSTKDNYERGILSRQESFDLSILNGKLKATLLVFNGTNNYRFYVNGATELHDGQWHHVAVTYDGSTAQLYLDGKKDGSATTYAGKLLPAIGAPVRIGTGSSGFIGQIDEAALYDHMVSASNVQGHWAAR